MKILENLLYQHRRGEKLTRDSENFIELRGRERIWKCWTTDSIGYDGDCSCRRDSWRIFRRRDFWIGEILTETSVKILQGKHFETILSLRQWLRVSYSSYKSWQAFLHSQAYTIKLSSTHQVCWRTYKNPFTWMFLVENLPMRSKHVYKAEHTLKLLLLHQLSDSIHKKTLYYTILHVVENLCKLITLSSEKRCSYEWCLVFIVPRPRSSIFGRRWVVLTPWKLPQTHSLIISSILGLTSSITCIAASKTASLNKKSYLLWYMAS